MNGWPEYAGGGQQRLTGTKALLRIINPFLFFFFLSKQGSVPKYAGDGQQPGLDLVDKAAAVKQGVYQHREAHDFPRRLPAL